MKNAFSQSQALRNEVKTNTFDWSHVNNVTTEIGKITPIFCQLVPPKFSGSIPVKLALEMMPMVFPNQTRMLAKVSFFKYPLRALWDGFRDYQGNFRQGLVEPFHDFAKIPRYNTGSLFDYLGLPTTYVDNANVVSYVDGVDHFPARASNQFFGSFDYFLNYIQSPSFKYSSLLVPNFIISNTNYVCRSDAAGEVIGDTEQDFRDATLVGSYEIAQSIQLNKMKGGSILIRPFTSSHFVIAIRTSSNWYFREIQTSVDQRVDIDSFNIQETGSCDIFIFGPAKNLIDSDVLSAAGQNPNKYWTWTSSGSSSLGWSFSWDAVPDQDLVPKDITSETCPWYMSSGGKFGDKGLKISAYSARCYEGIYNAYFRNIQNDPFYVNGQVEYNKFLPTYDGGIDTYPYDLHYINWERDVFTTAIQSPQQGIAPLVGLTTYNDSNSYVTNEDGSVTYSPRIALTDEDGNSYGVDFDTDDEGLIGVRYTKLSPDIRVSRPTSLIGLAQSGIAINDLRNVNCYQKYLELNIRSGYSYKEITQNRYNVKVRYSDLLMPEYLGGFTTPINMRSITQTVEQNGDGSYAGALGAQAGVAYCSRDSQNITVFCDEESIIMGLLTVVPIPVYSQILPKHFLYRDLLDHFTPEFTNIGYQPILNRELCPLQCETLQDLQGTFGYQRPWYEYLSMVDTAHGQYRLSMRNFLMQRTYAVPPVLGREFLTCRPDQVNDVFSVTEATDKIYGQIYFGAAAKLPIPRRSVPRLD